MKASRSSVQAHAQLLSVVLPVFREASGVERMPAVLEDKLSGMSIPCRQRGIGFYDADPDPADR